MDIHKLVSWVALIAVVGLGTYVFTDKDSFVAAPGAAGNLLAENYIPYILYNDGYRSERDMHLVTTAGATSTLTVGCVSAYATSSATQVRLMFNSVATSSAINGGTIGGHVLWGYGACQ